MERLGLDPLVLVHLAKRIFGESILDDFKRIGPGISEMAEGENCALNLVQKADMQLNECDEALLEVLENKERNNLNQLWKSGGRDGPPMPKRGSKSRIKVGCVGCWGNALFP
jgi:hypothetical protein